MRDAHDGVTLCDAGPDDLPAIHSMLCAIAGETGHAGAVTADLAALRRDGFGDNPAFTCLLAMQAGEPVGMAIYFPEYSSWRGERGCYLLDLYVTPQLRSRGIAQHLLAELALRARNDGAAYLRLNADRDNERGRRFYRALGFAESDRDRQFLLRADAFLHLGACRT